MFSLCMSYGLAFHRKSGNVQGQDHCSLQISATAAQFRTYQGEACASVAQIITSESVLFFYLLLTGITP